MLENENASELLSTHPQATYRLKSKPMTQERLQKLRGPDGPKWNVLVTGAAGFVGMHTCLELKRIGMNPIGYDVVNDYYSIELKELRIEELRKNNIPFVRGDVCDEAQLRKTLKEHNIQRIIHLAAQAGVRYSLDHPFEYTRNNVDCTLHVLEVLAHSTSSDLAHLHLNDQTLIYASSSSVYGNNRNFPFRETDHVEDPASLYAATKRSNELMATAYHNLHNVTSIGLRFFTVYGPFGRPDMAPWIFTDKISNNQTIKVFNYGRSKRDFTYIDDIVQGVVNSLFAPNTKQPEVLNLGFGRPIVLADFVSLVEKEVGSVANKHHMPMQKGDVPVTYADVTKARRLIGYNPKTPIEVGIAKFVQWFRQYDASKYRMEQRR